MKQRRMDLIKITQENEAILQRLQKRKSTFSVDKWETDYSKHVQYRENTSKGVFQYGKPPSIMNKMSIMGTECGTSRFHHSSIQQRQSLQEPSSQSPIIKSKNSPVGQSKMMSVVDELPRIGTGSMTVKTQPRSKNIRGSLLS